MKHIIRERIESLRKVLRREGLNAFIIPSTDPHMSEYIAPHWKSREWISGFTGSAGTVVVTLEKAGLWTDSRYFIQAAEQLEDTGITLFKEMLPGTPSITGFLSAELKSGQVVGMDGKVFAASEANQLEKELTNVGIRIRTDLDPINEIWENRPPIPKAPAFVYDMEYAGKSCTDKINEIRTQLKHTGAESILLSALDEIAWTLNLRGTDVKCNPVVISYLFLTQTEAVFFISTEKVSPEVRKYLESQQVSIYAYNEIENYLAGITASTILLTPLKTNFSILSAVNSACRPIFDASPVAMLKAVRNSREIAGLHEAMRKDGVALVRFLKWLEEAVPAEKETELSVDRKLHVFRAAQPLYIGESFNTIAGYGEHGAIVHYSATEESNAVIRPKGFLLLDSGAQYLDGTTDITRTIAVGQLTEEEKTDYTLVLKGHIALAMANFPAGTRGAQLDILARLPLWKHKMNYLHGTGHGIGHFLNVHEGPQSIRMNENPVVLQPGMLTSNEPGVYKAGSHGVRTENLVLVVPEGEGMYGEYYRFETVTLCPIDTKGIIKEMLSEEETGWLNEYHRKVYEVLSPLLNDEEKEWLSKATQNL